jgi:hypothetical protein
MSTTFRKLTPCSLVDIYSDFDITLLKFYINLGLRSLIY